MTSADNAASMALRRSRDLPGRDPRPSELTLEQVKALHPTWTIERAGLDLMCRSGAFRVRAEDPDDAHREILLREQPWAMLQSPG